LAAPDLIRSTEAKAVKEDHPLGCAFCADATLLVRRTPDRPTAAKDPADRQSFRSSVATYSRRIYEGCVI